MPSRFTVPNAPDVTDLSQAEVDKGDWEAIIRGIEGTGVLSGMDVTPQSALTVAVAAGTYQIAGASQSYGGGTVALATANGTNPRYDIVYADVSGVAAVQGTAQPAPMFPTIPANAVYLAAVEVRAGAGVIVATDIVGKSVPVNSNALPAATGSTVPTPNSALTGYVATRWHTSVMRFGADPTHSSDAAPPFRSARDYIRANSGKGTIYAPWGSYRMASTETISVQGTNRAVALKLDPRMRLVGDGHGSGRSGGTDSTSGHAATQINGDAAMWAVILGSNTSPDWRPYILESFHVKDTTTGHDQVDHGVVIHSANNSFVCPVSISHFQKTGAWGMRILVADNGEPAQYGRIRGSDMYACDNGLFIDGTGTGTGGNPDWIISDFNIIRHGGASPPAGKKGVYIKDTNKVTLSDMAIQNYSGGIDVDGLAAGHGKHMTFYNVHIEGESSAANDSYEYAIRMRAQAASTHLPILRDVDIAGSKFAVWLSLTDIQGARISNFRIRDTKWMVGGDSKFVRSNSTGTIDGVAF